MLVVGPAMHIMNAALVVLVRDDGGYVCGYAWSMHAEGRRLCQAHVESSGPQLFRQFAQNDYERKLGTHHANEHR